MVLVPEPADLRDLVALMYRADWTTLSLSATLSQRTDHDLLSRMNGTHPPGTPDGEQSPDGEQEPELPATEVTRQILLAAGGKYRIGAGEVPLVIRDGESVWAKDESYAALEAIGQPPHLLDQLLNPARLLTRFTLEAGGTSVVSGRAAYRLQGRLRPFAARDTGDAGLLDHVYALVDADLGVLLHYEEGSDGQPVRRATLTDVTLDPAAAQDTGQFRPPPGFHRCVHPFTTRNVEMPGLTGDAVRAAAGLAGTALGFAIRHWPGRAGDAGGAGAGGTGAHGAGAHAMPGSAGPMPTEWLPPAGDDLVNLLHRTGLPAQNFTAEIREWTDLGQLARLALRTRESFLPPALGGILGPDAVWDALAGRGGRREPTMRLRVAAPGRYRIDTLTGGQADDPETVASDGEQRWVVNGGRVSAWRDYAPPFDLGWLADPAWLLTGRTLLAGGETEVAGRRGFVVVATRSQRAGLRDLAAVGLPGLLSHVEVVVDAELGILLQAACFFEDRPVTCYETRDVTAGVAGDGVFDVPPGAHTGGPFGGARPPSPAGAVKAAAGLGVAGAAAVIGWLQKRPRTPDSSGHQP